MTMRNHKLSLLFIMIPAFFVLTGARSGCLGGGDGGETPSICRSNVDCGGGLVCSAGSCVQPEPEPSACDDQPCLNEGSCSESGSSFTCSCVAGLSGDRCESSLFRGRAICSLTAGSGLSLGAPADGTENPVIKVSGSSDYFEYDVMDRSVVFHGSAGTSTYKTTTEVAGTSVSFDRGIHFTRGASVVECY